MSRDGPPDAKKNGLTKRKSEYWVIPPAEDAEFVADMEEGKYSPQGWNLEKLV